MSYTAYISNKLSNHLNNFYEIYGSELDEEMVHEQAGEYVTRDTLYFIKTLEELANCIVDKNFVDAMECRMKEHDYYDLLFLADDAMGDLIWEYIINNY